MTPMPLGRLAPVLLAVVALSGAPAAAAPPTAQQILDQVLDLDPWGLVEAEVSARVFIRDAAGLTRELAFTARSRRWAPGLSKSLVRFSAPADLAGVSFLQVQRKSGDDDRHLYLPELRRSKRIAGDLRPNAFMGTDFSYGDLDRRDLRESRPRLKGEETLGKYRCWVLELTPTAAEATYARVELWVRQDNFVPLRTTMYNRAGVHLKTLTTQEVRRVGGRWFITRSLMHHHPQNRKTELVIEKIVPRTDIADDEFTVRNLEKV
jgi:hypothetical protein